jgi:hypothetical protein
MLIWVVSLLFILLLFFAFGQQTLFRYLLIVEPGALFGASYGKEEETRVMFH